MYFSFITVLVIVPFCAWATDEKTRVTKVQLLNHLDLSDLFLSRFVS